MTHADIVADFYRTNHINRRSGSSCHRGSATKRGKRPWQERGPGRSGLRQGRCRRFAHSVHRPTTVALARKIVGENSNCWSNISVTWSLANIIVSAANLREDR